MESQRNVGTLEQYAKSWKYITTSCHHVYCYIDDGRQSWYLYLEVTSDKRHTCKPHIAHVEGNARQKLTGVQLNIMVYNCKDQPTIPRQDSRPGTTHHYRRNEVHTHNIHEANHRYTTSSTETISKGPSSSREMPPRSSHEGEGRGPYQEQNKENQFHTWSKEATERLSRSTTE